MAFAPVRVLFLFDRRLFRSRVKKKSAGENPALSKPNKYKGEIMLCGGA